MQPDAIIIGSGFGGCVAALRLAEKGLRVLVLERGRHTDDREFERLARGESPLLRLALGDSLRRPFTRPAAAIEVRVMPGLTGILGCGVGGGSLHYTSVVVSPHDDVYSAGWPREWTAQSMQPYYQRVAERLRPTPIPAPAAQTRAIESAASILRAKIRHAPAALDWQPPRGPSFGGDWRRDIVNWMRAGGATNKITLTDAYLRRACELGASVAAEHTVSAIQRKNALYHVHCVCRRGGRMQRTTFVSPRVVLSAGAFSSTQLLLTARDVHRTLDALSPMLGGRFSTNGDDGALLVGPRMPWDDGPSPPATALLDYWDTDRLMLMDLGRVPVFARLIRRVLRRPLWLRDRFRAQAAPVAWIIGAMGHEPQSGRLRLDRKGNMVYERPRGNGGLDNRIVRRLRELASACGATLLRAPTFISRRHPVTVHPLGGCAIADSPDDGACDPEGRVFGCPGLYVADGSIIPTALGCPPSMTIAAAAERVAEAIVKNDVGS